MLSRLKAAWKVLRGEYIAVPHVQIPSVWYTNGHVTTTSATENVWYTPARERI